MQQVFKAIDWLQVPDTTWLSPFLNAKDVNSGLDSELLGAFSLAMGKIRPGQPSTVRAPAQHPGDDGARGDARHPDAEPVA